jgi:membrane protein involved in colicin uptake
VQPTTCDRVRNRLVVAECDDACEEFKNKQQLKKQQQQEEQQRLLAEEQRKLEEANSVCRQQ